jgi:hypothetical protein
MAELRDWTWEEAAIAHDLLDEYERIESEARVKARKDRENQ